MFHQQMLTILFRQWKAAADSYAENSHTKLQPTDKTNILHKNLKTVGKFIQD